MARTSKITHAHCIGPYSLAVTWDDGRSICIDLSGWVANGGEVLTALKQARTFTAVKIDDSGSCLRWGSIAIAADHLARIAEEQCAFSRSDITTWQADLGLSNSEAADFLGISLSSWNTYKAGTNPVPAPVAMVCRAALRDPILRQARYKPRTRGRPSTRQTAQKREPE